MRMILLLLAACLLTSCVTRFGPRTVRPARFDYNQAIARSNDEQMLLNLVRLRYRDTPQFLAVNSVLSQYSIGAGASAGVRDADDTIWDLGADVSYSERPTISYAPLQGEEFARRMLTPVAPESLILLAQSGWSIERLALCCVEELNDLRNAPSASGPTPMQIPRYEEFRRVAERLRALQVAGLIDLRLDVVDAGQEGERRETWMFVQTQPPAEWAERVAEIRRLLELPAEGSHFRLSAFRSNEPGTVTIRGRSIFGMLFYLSQAVEVPAKHREHGLVTRTPDATGGELNWFEVTGGLLRVRADADRPDDPFVAVRYRDHWFWIADDDLESKTTFSLVNLLFALQAAPGGAASPLLTVDAGR